MTASEKLSVEGALTMARNCRYLDNGPVPYDRTLYGAVWALADEVERLRALLQLADEEQTKLAYKVAGLQEPLGGLKVGAPLCAVKDCGQPSSDGDPTLCREHRNFYNALNALNAQSAK